VGTRKASKDVALVERLHNEKRSKAKLADFCWLVCYHQKTTKEEITKLFVFEQQSQFTTHSVMRIHIIYLVEQFWIQQS
jgi:hypothetical protein